MYRTEGQRNLFFHQALFIVQVFAFLISALSDYIAPGLAQLAYLVAVFSSPILVICFGHRYFMEDKFRIQTLLPFCAELLFSIVYVSSMIYGTCDHTFTQPLRELFQRLLIVFIVDIVICGLGYVVCRFDNRGDRVGGCVCE